MTLFDESPDFRKQRLLAATEQLEEARSQTDIIAAVRATARAAFGSDGVTFILREGDLCHYVEEDAIGPLWKGQRFDMAKCISGWSMMNVQTAVIEDVFADARIPHDAYRPTFVKSLIMTPAGEDSPVAAIGAYWSYRRKFSDTDVMAVKILGGAVGRALVGLI